MLELMLNTECMLTLMFVWYWSYIFLNRGVKQLCLCIFTGSFVCIILIPCFLFLYMIWIMFVSVIACDIPYLMYNADIKVTRTEVVTANYTCSDGFFFTTGANWIVSTCTHVEGWTPLEDKCKGRLIGWLNVLTFWYSTECWFSDSSVDLIDVKYTSI